MTSPRTPRPQQPVDYKGEPLDAARGPGLGCFWLQVVVLASLVILTPLTVSWGWSPVVSGILLFLVILLLLFTGQTIIFLLRLVAAGRTEGRRRPLASGSPTVGELEDEPGVDAGTGRGAVEPSADGAGGQAAAHAADPRGDDPGMRE